MALSIKHNAVVAIPDDESSPVGSDEWNAAHDIVTDSTDPVLLGRATGGAGAIVDLSPGTVINVLSGEAAPATLTDATMVAIDWSTFIFATLAMGGNRTLGNPTNVVPGTSRMILITATSSTERTPSYAANYLGALPDETVTDTRGLLLTLTAIATDQIVPTWKVVEL